MKRRLYKSEDNRVLFGVCGGVAEYIGVDPTIVRLVWAASILLFGLGLWLYIIAVLLMPREPVD